MEQLYQERLARYTTAMRNEKPDRMPIRPFVAEFTAKYAGFTCQEVTHDYNKAFVAARKCAADFDWDAVVGNMVYVWTGLTQAIGLKYYAVPGIDIPPNTGFQYREPAEDDAFMKADEYDALIDDPTGFLYNVWLPRVSADVSDRAATATGTTSPWSRAGWRCWNYFMAFGPQGQALADGVRHGRRHRRHPQGAVRHPGRQAARLHRAHDGHDRPARQGAQRVRGADAAPLSRGADHRRPQRPGAHRLLDAPRLRAVRLAGAVRVTLLADDQADHRGALGERAPDAVLRRGRLGRAPRPYRRTAGREHRLPRRSRRHLRGSPQARPQVLPQRRHPELPAGVRHAG